MSAAPRTKAEENAASEELCEDKLMVMHNALSKASGFVTQSRGEIYCGALHGHAFFFPGLPWWPIGKWRLPAAEFEELSNSMKAMGRLLFNLHLAFDEGFDGDLLDMLRQQYPGALLPHLATTAHGCLQDATDAFPGRPFVSPGHLHRFHQAVEGLLAISDFQRRRVFQRLRPAQRQLTKMRTARRHRPDGTLSPAATLSPAPSTRPSMHRSMSAATRRGSFRDRFSPVSSPPEGSHLATAAAAKAGRLACPPPAHSSGAAATGQSESHSATKEAPETLGETQQRRPGRSPFEAFDNLPDDLHITIASEPGSAATSPPERTGLWQQQESMRVKQGDLREALSIRLQRVPSEQLLVFPDTAQGHISQVRWYSFQFLISEIAEELQELHETLGELLFKLPSGVFRH